MTAELECRSCDSQFPSPATDIGEIKLVDPATREPSGSLGYWPLCHSHMMMALIAGWNPVKIDTPEGQRRVARLAAVDENGRKG